MNIRNTIAAINQMQADITFNLSRILQSKRDFRQRLAARPIEEKLALLDALRERTLALRPVRSVAGAGVLHEELLPYRVQGNPPE